MSRRNRVALAAAAVLVIAATGTVLATRLPRQTGAPAAPAASAEAEPDGAAPTADALRHASDRLAASGIAVDDAELADLAGRYGLGGAVRLFAWADASGRSVDDLAAMRDGDGTPGSVMGWGRMAKELGVHPGIGSIMGGGQGAGHAGGSGGASGDGEGADEPEASGD
jgi:hypothetical protein